MTSSVRRRSVLVETIVVTHEGDVMGASSSGASVMERERGDGVDLYEVLTCTECRHAQAFAQYPRAYCTCADGVRAGQRVYDGQLSCSHFVARRTRAASRVRSSRRFTRP